MRAVDVAGEWVKDQLRARALDSLHCFSPRAIRCGPLDAVGDYTVDTAVVRGDTAFIAIRYAIVGRLEQRDSALRFVQSPADSSGRAAIDTVVIVRDSTAWWHLRGGSAPRISALLVALYFQLSQSDRDRLISSAAIDSTDLKRPVLADPASISVLPAAMRDTLARLGCRVPQAAGHPSDNVVHGAFFGPGGDDWGVFCARGDTERILVFRGGSGRPAATLDPILVRQPTFDRMPDPFELASMRFGCTGSIYTVSANDVRAQVVAGETAELDGSKLSKEERATPPHDAIGDGDCEGVSNLHYWTGKRWVRLSGAD